MIRILLISLFLTGTLLSQVKDKPAVEKEQKEAVKNEEKDTVKKEELQETLFLKSLQLLEELTSIVESADDKESTAAAVKKIQALSEKAVMIRRACDAAGLDNMTAKQQKALTDKHKTKIHTVSLRLLNAIQLDKGRKELSAALEEIIGKM